MSPLSFALALLEDPRRYAPGGLGRRPIDINQVLMICLLEGQVPGVDRILLRFDPLWLLLVGIEARLRTWTPPHGTITFFSDGFSCCRCRIGHLDKLTRAKRLEESMATTTR